MKITQYKNKIIAFGCAMWLFLVSSLCFALINGTGTNFGFGFFEISRQFSYRQTLLGMIGLYIFSLGVFSFWVSFKIQLGFWTRFLAVWFQSVSVGLAGFLYFATVKKAILGVFELNLPFFTYFLPPRILVIHTGYVVIPLLVLLFFVNYNLFGQNKLQKPLLLLQNLLFTVLCFSFLELIKSDRTVVRTFNSNTLSFIGSINPNVWVLICVLVISTVSILHLKLVGLGRNLGFVFLMFLILSQFLLFLSPTKDFSIVNFGSFTYWHKSIFLVIFWSFIFYPISLISTTKQIDKFRDKFILSSLYHFLILTIAFSLILI